MRFFLILTLTISTQILLPAQILFSESFNVLLDTTKRMQGSITPELKIQTQKRTLVEFTNMTDMAFRIGRNSLTIANKVELNKFGQDTFLSGGYVYVNFKEDLDRYFSIQYFAQVHWAEARGLARRYAGGPILRLKIIKNPKIGLFDGTGPMYEWEEWNYQGVEDDKLPTDLTPIVTEYIKSATYISYKHWVTQRIFVDLSVYHQARYTEVFSTPRIASSTRLSYQLSEHLQVIGLYQNIYDYRPQVPIDSWFHRFIGTFAFSF